MTMELRTPEIEDARESFRIARNEPNIDANTEYYYMIWYRDFSETSLVAVSEGKQIGYLTAFISPKNPDTLFIWQIATMPHHGVPNLGIKMMTHVVDKAKRKGVEYVEATVSPDNRPINYVMRLLAKRLAANYSTSMLFNPDAFEGSHEAELMYRIGPLEEYS